MKVLLVLIFISLNTYGSCDFKDITGKDKDQVTARQDLMRADSDTEGVRLAWNGMKDMNKLYIGWASNQPVGNGDHSFLIGQYNFICHTF